MKWQISDRMPKWGPRAGNPGGNRKALLRVLCSIQGSLSVPFDQVLLLLLLTFVQLECVALHEVTALSYFPQNEMSNSQEFAAIHFLTSFKNWSAKLQVLKRNECSAFHGRKPQTLPSVSPASVKLSVSCIFNFVQDCIAVVNAVYSSCHGAFDGFTQLRTSLCTSVMYTQFESILLFSTNSGLGCEAHSAFLELDLYLFLTPNLW